MYEVGGGHKSIHMSSSRSMLFPVLFPQGEVTPIGAVSRAVTGVKMRSNSQGTFWGSVKRSSSVLGHYLRHYWRSRGVVDPFVHAQLIDGQGSRAKIHCGQAVKAVFRQSKILTPVAALDTASMGVTPPPPPPPPPPPVVHRETVM